jgi:hypothetical protein
MASVGRKYYKSSLSRIDPLLLRGTYGIVAPSRRGGAAPSPLPSLLQAMVDSNRRRDNRVNTVMRDTKSSFRMAGLSTRVLNEGIWLAGRVPFSNSANSLPRRTG